MSHEIYVKDNSLCFKYLSDGKIIDIIIGTIKISEGNSCEYSVKDFVHGNNCVLRFPSIDRMIEHYNFYYERSCKRKVGYDSRRQAKFKQKYLTSFDGSDMKVYHCYFCNKFHVSHNLKDDKGYKDNHVSNSLSYNSCNKFVQELSSRLHTIKRCNNDISVASMEYKNNLCSIDIMELSYDIVELNNQIDTINMKLRKLLKHSIKSNGYIISDIDFELLYNLERKILSSFYNDHIYFVNHVMSRWSGQEIGRVDVCLK